VRVRVRNQQDLLAGALFLAIAFGALWVSWDYPLGTAVRMSSGYVPRLLCILLAVIGLYVFVRAFAVEGPPVSTVRLRPLALITLAVAVFAYAIPLLGVVIASFLLTFIGGYASPRVRFVEMLAVAAALSFVTVAIFVWGIGLPIPVWPEF
jgi:putative tricarboxylic transport membrane protein